MFIFLLLLPFFAFGIEAEPQQGIIILLNGPLGARKGEVQDALQKSASALLLKAGMNNFFDAMLPDPDLSTFKDSSQVTQTTKSGELIRKITLSEDEQKHPLFTLEIGPAGDRVISGMHQAFAAYAKRGNNLAVDYTLYNPLWLPDLVKALITIKVYVIGINAPLDVIEEWEKQKGPSSSHSPLGHSRTHYNTVNKGMVYDLELDVSKLTPEECAQRILDFVQDHPNPSAFNRIYRNIFSPVRSINF